VKTFDPVWRKSTASAQGNCVEVANIPQSVLVRDSKQNGDGPMLRFQNDSWVAFIQQVRTGDFDRD